MLNYLYQITDEYGYIHSLDKLVIIFSLKVQSDNWLLHIIDELREIRDKYKIETYDEKLDLKPRSDFSWCKHFIKFNYGLPVFLGAQVFSDHYNGGTTMIYNAKIEVNPNNVFEYPYFMDVLQCLNRNSFDYRVKRVDYAIDVNAPPDEIVVLMSRKDKRIFKDTRYYGTRSKHMALKIYNKAKEQCLGSDLTRIEYTVECNKKIKFDRIMILDKNNIDKVDELNSTELVMVKMCLALRNQDLDYVEFIKGLAYYKRKKIIEHVEGSGRLLVYDNEIYDKLFSNLMGLLHLDVPDLLDLDEENTLETDWNESIGYDPFTMA